MLAYLTYVPAALVVLLIVCVLPVKPTPPKDRSRYSEDD